MRNIYRSILLGAVLAGFAVEGRAQLIINELMQSNIDCIMDDINEFPDSWVELYNTGTSSVRLNEYSLGDSPKPEKAYALPNREIAPGGYIVIYCDKEEQGLHTDFRLDSGKGGSVYLFHNGEIADKVEEWKKQPAPNIAYGRETDGGEKWGYQAEPTPGKRNCGRLCKELLGDPVFSRKGCVLDSDLELVLGLPDDAPEGTVIRYTLNGKEPTAVSPAYSSSIKITKTNMVRAKLFCDGYLSPRSVTHSYIRHPREMSLPVVSIVSDYTYFYADKEGILTEGKYSPGTPNYEYDWRRPINFEYFEEPDKESVINQLCETRVKGGATRGNALKSLAVYANKRFGTKRFNYEFFPDQTPGVEEFKSFELRNSGNDFDYMYMRDAVIQQCMGMNSDLDWQPSRPVIVYINGKYMGLLNIRPRSNEDYVYSYYDALEDIDMLENWWELKEGKMDSFNDFKAFYEERGHSYGEFTEWMDTEEFCNLMIMGTFFDNKDFPGNNIVMWRPQADGGRWRWIAKDTDFGMGLYGERSNYPTLYWISNQGYDNNRNDWANKWEHTRLFRRLLDTPEFRDMFIDRAAVYMGSFLTSEAIIARIDARYAELKPEYKSHRDQINPWWPTYDNEVEWGRRWSRERPDYFYGHLADFFSLEAPVPLTIHTPEPEDLIVINLSGSASGVSESTSEVRPMEHYAVTSDDLGLRFDINGVELTTAGFDGKFFPGRQLTVKSVSVCDGLYVVGWDVTVEKGGNKTTERHDGEVFSGVMPQGDRVSLVPVLSTEPAAIDLISDDRSGIDFSKPFRLYDLSGRDLGIVSGSEPGSVSAAALPPLPTGIYILRQGASTRKITVK